MASKHSQSIFREDLPEFDDFDGHQKREKEKTVPAAETARPAPSASKTRKILAHFRHAPYVFLPLLAAVVWFSGLLALLLLWVKAGRPRYSSTEAKIAFISEVGGAHENLFLAICCVVDVLFFSSVCAIKWLRHTERLPGRLPDGTPIDADGVEEEDEQEIRSVWAERWRRSRGRVQWWASWLAIFFCFVGCTGLFILAKWNCFEYDTIHWDGTLVFVTGIGLSATCQTIEVVRSSCKCHQACHYTCREQHELTLHNIAHPTPQWLLRRDHPHRRHLVVNSYAKLAVVGTEVVCASIYGYMYLFGKAVLTVSHDIVSAQCHGEAVAVNNHTAAACDQMSSTAAIFEWGLAFLLNCYFLTLLADLWPAGKVRCRSSLKGKKLDGQV